MKGIKKEVTLNFTISEEKPYQIMGGGTIDRRVFRFREMGLKMRCPSLLKQHCLSNKRKNRGLVFCLSLLLVRCLLQHYMGCRKDGKNYSIKKQLREAWLKNAVYSA